MLHGCRSDLILNCLVKSNKDRNLYSYFSNLNLIKNRIIRKHLIQMINEIASHV